MNLIFLIFRFFFFFSTYVCNFIPTTQSTKCWPPPLPRRHNHRHTTCSVMTWLQAKSFFGPPLFEILILLIDPNEFPEARWKRWQQSLYKVPVYTVCCFQARARTDKHQSSTQTAWQIWRGDMSHMLVIPLLLYYLSMA